MTLLLYFTCVRSLFEIVGHVTVVFWAAVCTKYGASAQRPLLKDDYCDRIWIMSVIIGQHCFSKAKTSDFNPVPLCSLLTYRHDVTRSTT